MRLLKKFVPAVIAATFALALTGVAPAAAVEKTVLCEAKEAPCTQIYAEGTEINAKSTNAEVEYTILGNTFFLTCKNSEFESNTLAKEGNLQLPGSVTFLNFQECKLPGGTPCSTFGVKELPWDFLLAHKAGQNGALTFFREELPAPGTEIVCGALDCLFRVAEEDAAVPERKVGHLTLTGGNPAKIEAVKLHMEQVGGCAVQDVYFHGTYTVTKPAKALWVSYVN